MYYLKTLIYFFLIGTIYAEKELSEEQKKIVKVLIECAKEWDISKEELKNLKQLVKDPTEKILCFMKCTAEKDGTLDEAGNVEMKNIERIIAMIKMKSEDGNRIKDCIRKVSQVKTCADVRNITKCMPSN